MLFRHTCTHRIPKGAVHQIPIHRVQLSWRGDATKRCGSEGFGDSIWLNVLNKRVFGYRWLEQLSAGELIGPMMQSSRQVRMKGVLAGLCCMLLPLQTTAAVSEALCAFTNAMAEFSAKLPMTVSMPSNVTRRKVDKSNALVWLLTTGRFDCGTGVGYLFAQARYCRGFISITQAFVSCELAAFKAIQDDMACKPDGFVRSHGVSEMRRWHSHDVPLAKLLEPEDCE